MREFIGLFRGKRLDNGEWVEGCLLQSGEARKFVPNVPFSNCYIVPKTDADIVRLVGRNTVGLDVWAYHVDPDTVGECTGLRDINGKLIFEGEIVRDMWCYLAHKGYVEDGKEPESALEEYLNTAERGVVKFCTKDVASCGCCYPPFVGSGFKAGEVNLTCCEIIGNIHDGEGRDEVN